MSPRLKRALKILLPIALGLFLIGYSYQMTSPEDRSEIVRYIREANLFWVGISVLIGILSHVSRAIRWNYLLEPMGYRPKLRNNILIILIAYLANLGIPRSGEFLRATALATYEDVPFQKGFGTIVTERIVDLIMLLLVILITLAAQTDIILGFLSEQGLGLTGSIVLLVCGVGGLFVLRAFLRRSSHPLANKVRGFVRGLLEGVLSIFKIRRKWAFLGHTLFIWTAYFGMFWVIKYTVPETVPLNTGELLVAFVAGAFAMTATPGGLGLYPIAVSQALALFGISTVSGDAFGWIMWIAQTLMVFFFGAISFLLLPLWNRAK
ncbi:lysylphosphatidylglycerol synthase transmembrane domain-containing protein [Robiginitalea sp. M366]|uniref:lysylphosphatidylglycerol synthase transmembrane domain-containing protein n=1 Tax=Robiginitalea aestuariiviva TaxID=3036903 RepID=UPI00240E963E|nr:lysylphosphatidylglycerol synthase transmembrane domain-containing protein [Robiginitalea aestuariiviva]MDG1571690.1 lysylphosphatidylglycerol synthase transmembrane domain-containing protein [Robiginitalea aestuariiviva]